MKIPRTPRLMFAAIIAAGATVVVLIISGLTDMAVQESARADRAEHALDDQPTTKTPDQARQLEALLDLFTFCQTHWTDSKCKASTSPGSTGSIIDVLGNAARDNGDGGDETTVTVRTTERTAPTPTRTTPAPTPRPTTPSPEPSDLTGTVNDVADQVDDTVKQLVPETSPSSDADNGSLVDNLLP